MSSSSNPHADTPHDDDDLPPSYSSIQNDTLYVVPIPSDGEQTVTQQQAEGPGAQPPPAYTDTYGTLDLSEGGMNTTAEIADDGRINININQKTRRLASLLTPALQRQWTEISTEQDTTIPPSHYEVPEFAIDVPPLNILIQIIGSRGDVQPFIALGKVLRERYRHRVRVATHPTFKGFVEENGLEFFSLGGDPSELMAFMVKNPGLMPSTDSLKAGDVTKRRKDMWEMLLGGWRACIEPGDGMSYQPAIERGGRGPVGRPFVADAIIANPPSFGHIHCAERLGIPLHLMFTMPWSPTAAFPHPLANIQSSDVESSLTNFLSYVLVEMMTWQGLGDLVNKFREKTLGVEAISTMLAPGMISRLKVPHTYCWSPTLIPKPHDWPSQLSVSGFYFLSLASSYTPPPELERFLSAGPPPVYIGFGSIVVADPNALTNKIFEAVRMVGCRALVSKGWGGIGADDLDIPENVMLLGNCPHDWLFPRCAAVVHHGGAGTTAAGISCGKSTVIVPFFGDQAFWGAMVSKAGAGPDPIPHAQLTTENLAEAIQKALSREVQAKAEVMGDSIRTETGSENGARGFLTSIEEMGLSRCDILRDRVAVWNVRGSDVKLSALAASALVEAKLIENGFAGLKLFRHKEWNVNQGPFEPISGGAGALMGTIGSILMGVGDFPKEIFKAVKKDKGKGVEGQTPTDRPSLQDNKSSSSIRTTDTKSSLDRTRTDKSSVEDMSQGAGKENENGKGGESTGFDIVGAFGASKSVSKIVGTGLRSPMDFTLGLAQGFRNAPKLYGDEIRPETRVTGFHSGLKAAGKELSLGLYDGITGLVTQPIKGAKEDGAGGAIRGIGKGISGLVLKSGAGVWGVPGYAMKGIHREILKLGTKDLSGYIETARAAQGLHELREHEELRQYIVECWNELKTSSSKKRPGPWNTRMRSWPNAEDEKKKLVDMRSYDDDRESFRGDEDLHRAIRASLASSSHPSSSSMPPSSTGRDMFDLLDRKGPPPLHTDRHDDYHLHEAIYASMGGGGVDIRSAPALQAHQEDPELAEAIRMSMMDTHTPPPPRAKSFDSPIRKPVPQSSSNLRAADSIVDEDGSIYDQELMRRIEELTNPTHTTTTTPGSVPANYSAPVGAEDTDEFDDLDLRRAIEESRGMQPQYQLQEIAPLRLSPITTHNDRSDSDNELARAVKESLRLEEEKRLKLEEEERVILEYVARMSREEEERRRAANT
ncbi:hypothetical protein BDD12DRAFT_771811 [Trichophaea hybrida]|nr:hypothetical protein BDD12DRAFT_771811 [Trichophaea hybrida]